MSYIIILELSKKNTKTVVHQLIDKLKKHQLKKCMKLLRTHYFLELSKKNGKTMCLS